MSIAPSRVRELEALCGELREELIDVLHGIQTGHPGGSPPARRSSPRFIRKK
jgi:hypothetical protein